MLPVGLSNRCVRIRVLTWRIQTILLVLSASSLYLQMDLESLNQRRQKMIDSDCYEAPWKWWSVNQVWQSQAVSIVWIGGGENEWSNLLLFSCRYTRNILIQPVSGLTRRQENKSNIIPAKNKKYRKKIFTKRFLQKYHENRVCCSRNDVKGRHHSRGWKNPKELVLRISTYL